MPSPKKPSSREQSPQDNNIEMENSSNGSYGSITARNLETISKSVQVNQETHPDTEKQAKTKKKVFKRVSSSDLSSAGTESGLNVSANSDEVVDFDDLIHHFGDCGRYQMLLFVLMVPFICFIAFVFYSQFFITLVPDHTCRVPELESLSLHERQLLAIPPNGKDGFDSCSMYNVDFVAEIRKGVTIGNTSWPRQKCIHGYEYDHSVIPFTTIATEMDWVCDYAFYPNLAQSIYYVGSICGGLLFGYISDNYGRIPALVGCNLIGAIFGSLTIFSTGFWTFAICRFFVGFAFDGCFAMMYILVVEYVGPKWRTFVCNISLGIFFASMTASLPWIVLYIGDWKIFTLLTSLPLMLAILTPLIVPESVRWLATKGKVDRIIKIMKKIERTNKKNVGPHVYDNIRKTCAAMQMSEENSKSYTFFDLFRMPQLRNNTIILIVIWMIIALSFDAHARNIDSLGLNLFLTFSLACAAEFPADVLLVLTIDRWGRRYTSATALVLGGILNLTATIVPFGAISATLAILGRLTINYSYNLGIQYTAELIPTVVRGQGVTFIHIMGFVAAIFAPFVVYLKNVATVLPLIVVGILGLIGGVMCLFLPETLNRELPQSLDDGEAFTKNAKK